MALWRISCSSIWKLGRFRVSIRERLLNAVEHMLNGWRKLIIRAIHAHAHSWHSVKAIFYWRGKGLYTFIWSSTPWWCISKLRSTGKSNIVTCCTGICVNLLASSAARSRDDRFSYRSPAILTLNTNRTYRCNSFFYGFFWPQKRLGSVQHQHK